jgi:hypothetical protein
MNGARLDIYRSVNFDELTVQGGALSFGMQNQVVYKFKGRGGQLTVERGGQSKTYQIEGGEKVHIIGHTAHFRSR